MVRYINVKSRARTEFIERRVKPIKELLAEGVFFVVADAGLLTHRLEHVRRHQHVIADDRERGVHDEVLVGFRQRRLVRRGRHVPEAGEGHGELGAEDGLVEQESLFGRAGKIEVGADAAHRVSPGRRRVLASLERRPRSVRELIAASQVFGREGLLPPGITVLREAEIDAVESQGIRIRETG